MKKEELALALGMGVQQVNELLYIVKRTGESGHATYVTNFAAAEGLRKRRLVSRYTRYVVGTDWADERGVDSQWRQEKPMRQTEGGSGKRGGFSRYGTTGVGTDWADERGVHSQWRQEKPMRQHEWYSTAAGD